MRNPTCVKILAVTILLLPILAAAQSTIHGQLSGVLGPGTYSVDGDCEVSVGETLTICPGTTFLHTGHFTWNVYGKFIAVGTTSMPIVFSHVTPSLSNTWGGIRFLQGAPNSSVLECCQLSWSRNVEVPTTQGGAIYSDHVTVTIRNCVVSYCSAAEGGGIYLDGADNSVIDSCAVVNCFADDGGGIRLNECSNVRIAHSRIGGNSATST